VLKAGEVIERGRFDDLLAQRGFFYDLYMSQFRRDEQRSREAASGNGHRAEPLPA
jgi:ATP-binding cassette subfamily B protein